MEKQIMTVDDNGDILRRHRTAWAAWEYANRSCNRAKHNSRALVNGKLLKLGTTADIVRGRIRMNQLVDGNNHELRPDGTVATTCIDGHKEITGLNKEGQILGYYEVLYTGQNRK